MRLFIAVDFPKEVDEYLLEVQSKLYKNFPELTLARSFHITLKFLGECENKQDIIDALAKIKFNKFKLQLSNKIGYFPNRNFIRVIWLGIKENKDLTELQKQIESSLSKFSFRRDFNFHPHITLARSRYVKDNQKYLKIIEKIELTQQEVLIKNFILLKSTLTSTGPVYEKIKEFS